MTLLQQLIVYLTLLCPILCEKGHALNSYHRQHS